jgi:VCBS repeat protein
VDGDGKNELVIAEGINLTVYRWLNGALQTVATHKSYDRSPFIALDIADINGNGRAEIFASRLNENDITSPVLELEGGRLKTIVKTSSWFYRVMNWPGRGKILAGQEKSIMSAGGYSNMVRDYFEKGIFQLTWDGAKYVRKQEEPLLAIPNVFIYNFAIGDLSGDNAPEIVMIDRNDNLRILDFKGEEIHRSDDYYGGTLNSIVTNPKKSETIDRDVLYIPARILIADLDKNGKNEVIINQNSSSVGRIAERFKDFKAGKMVSLSWTGLSLDPNWESRKLSGCLSDYQIKDLDNDGKPDLVVALLQKRRVHFLKDARSVLVSYELRMGQKEEED